MNRAMALTLRPTGLSSPAYADRLDYTIFDNGKPVGRMYEDKHAPELPWFWSITVYVDSQAWHRRVWQSDKSGGGQRTLSAKLAAVSQRRRAL